MIVFITIPWFAPAYKAGGPIQSIVNLVSNYTNDVTYKIFCSNKDLDETVLDKVKTDTWVKFNNCAEVFYTSNFNKKLLHSEVEKSNPDLIFIIGIFSWQYNILPMLMTFKKRKILSVRGMLHPGALSQKSVKKNIFIKTLKLFNITDNLIFHATDNEEESHIQNIFGQKSKIKIASNFGKQVNRISKIEKEIGFLKIITVALISPMKNYLLVLQALKKCSTNIEYTICGAVKDASYWQLCLNEIDTMPSNIKVNYIGEVLPTAVEKYLLNNHVFIMPSKSENFGHAIYEALSAKIPVITSNFTPWINLQESHAGINVETELESIKSAINLFANMDNNTFQKYSDSAFEYFLNKNEIDLKMQSYFNLFS
jgi:glycosyltransferase involved in cell wall biosynthesis